jgi:hypothetical protein
LKYVSRPELSGIILLSSPNAPTRGKLATMINIVRTACFGAK